ncbi:MAG: hypothetical protein ACMUIG_05500 [Thermoplasmatota archaeon]
MHSPISIRKGTRPAPPVEVDDNMKWSFGAAVVLLAILILSAFSIINDGFIGEADGSGSQAATFDEIIMEVSPSVQGYGGEVEVALRAYFYGGCCYSLFANDIVPGLTIPENLTIVSGPTPAEVDELTAVAGGEPTIKTFRWTLRCNDPGSFFINCSVDTSNCGRREASGMVHVIKGASISKPTIYPENPISDKEMSIIFESSYPVGEIDIVDAVLYYHASDANMEQLQSENGTLFHDGEKIEDTFFTECEKDDLHPNRFSGSIPATEKRYVYYWMVVADENGNITTSSVFRYTVEDVGKVDRLNGISFLFLFISTALLILVLYAGQNLFRRFENAPEDDDNFHVLGPIGRKRFPPPAYRKKKPMMADTYLPYAIVIIIAAAGLIAVVYGVISGDAAELFRHLLDGK